MFIKIAFAIYVVLSIIFGIAQYYRFAKRFVEYGAKMEKQLLVHETENEKIREENARWVERTEQLEKDYYDKRVLYQQSCDSFNEAIERMVAAHDDKLQNLQSSTDKAIEDEKQRFEEAKKNFQTEYQIIVQDYLKEHNETLEELNTTVQNLKDILADNRKIVDCAVEANKKLQKEQEQKNFYKLILSEQDQRDISLLREMIPKLKNPEAINKVIWKEYYEKPYTSLVGRVVGAGVHCGIYKITNLENQMCYVGQAVNIGERWRQHIKRGIGAEAPTRNKLYPAMLSFGVENFSFEVIEECSKQQLNDREDFWQDYFHAKDFGYSIK